MREILFRGKRIDNGEWVYGYYAFRRKRRGAFGQTITELDFDTHYIAVLEENGKKIFEGDIVSRVSYIGMGYREMRGEVVYRAPEFLVDCKYHRVMILSQYAPENKDLEVIGNIHDSPELLEE